MNSVSLKFARVSQNVKNALILSGREPDSVTIVGVTKAQPFQVAVIGAQCGILDLGESRLQEASRKIPVVEKVLMDHQVDISTLTWHMIGRLQSNKAAKAARLFDVIHSVDSEKVARILARTAGDEGKKLRVFVEVNISSQLQKGGIPVESTLEFVTEIIAMKSLHLEGLMTIGQQSVDDEIILKSFRTLRLLNDNIAERYDEFQYGRQLSMGMSSDYRLAVREGATIVRIGSAIFGPRPG